MSDLQFSLIVIGATIIGGVCLYNWVQERNFRKRLDQAFGTAPEDVLLPRGRDAVEGKIEPQLQPVPPAPRAVRVDGGSAAPARQAPGTTGMEPDADLDCVAEIETGATIAEGPLDELLGKLAGCGRPIRVLGLNADTGGWEEPTRGRSARYRSLKLALQLVNRSGTANSAQLAMFCDAARSCAEKSAGRAVLPDLQTALKAAQDLDQFCSEVDVAIGVNVIAEEGATFPGARIRELAEAAGFTLEPDGVFHYRGGQRRTLFTLDNHQPAPFLPERLKSLATPGITLMLDVPRVADGPAVLDRMLDIGRGLAAALGGRLVDDNRAALSEVGIARIREQLQSINAALAARGITAGGERALRLFS